MALDIIRKPGSIIARILRLGEQRSQPVKLVSQEVLKPQPLKRKGCNCRKRAK